MRVADIERQVEDRFSKLDERLTVIYEKINLNQILISLKSIESRLHSLEERLDTIDEKFENSQESKRGLIGEHNSVENSQEEPFQLNVMNFVESMNVELVTKIGDISETVEDLNNKVEQNKNLLNRNYDEILGIKENLHTRQERRERGHVLDQHTELINEILSVVKNKLKDRGEDDAMLANDENKAERSTTLKTIPRKKQPKSNNQTLASKLSSARKGGIVYPMKNVLQPPTNNSTAFANDRDIKVITLHCFFEIHSSLPFNDRLLLQPLI